MTKPTTRPLSIAAGGALLLLVAHAPCSNGWITPQPQRPLAPTSQESSSRRAASAGAAPPTSPDDASLSNASAEEKSAELLFLLVGDGPDRSSSSSSLSRINSLVSSLAFPPPSSPSNTYDPATCLYGDLWCTVHDANFANPDAPAPLWERISLRRDNIKGQQYYRSGGGGGEGSTARGGYGDVINYSEIWGPAVRLAAGGSFRPRAEANEGEGGAPTEAEDGKSAAGGRRDGQKSGFLDLGSMVAGWMKGGGASAATKTKAGGRRSCPDDYAVTVSKATISVFGWDVDVPIEGVGYLRVLYADERLRIFISPVKTRTSDGKGDWEREGLVVVQVRSDLVSETGDAIDLRA